MAELRVVEREQEDLDAVAQDIMDSILHVIEEKGQDIPLISVLGILKMVEYDLIEASK